MRIQNIKKYFIRIFSGNFLSSYAIAIGIFIIAHWIMLILTDEIIEGKYEISLHIFSELTMALLVICGGYMSLKNKRTGTIINLVGQSMILYSALNAIGYFIELNEFVMLPILSVTFLLSFCSVISIILYLKNNLA